MLYIVTNMWQHNRIMLISITLYQVYMIRESTEVQIADRNEKGETLTDKMKSSPDERRK